ncbi:MAG TPA: hypothetical protein DIS66_08010 [Candidatus Omnitrophica bacterium]|nr:hypothetical protein [Candidatus Omnitrophota bacterium]
MNKKRFLLAPVFSFFDFKIYKEAASFKPGKSLLYLAYLSALFSVALFFFGLANLSKAEEFLDWLKKNVSGITISDTGMKLDISGRKEIIHPQLGALAVFDDTREVIQPGEMGEYRFYMTSKMMYVNQNGVVQSSVIGSKAKKSFKTYIDAALIQKLYDLLKWPVAIFVLFAAFFVGFLTRALTALILTAFGFLTQLFMPRKLSFSNLFGIGSIALSAALFFSALQLLPVLAPFSPGLLGVLLAIAYFVIGVMVQPKPASEEDKSI